MSERIPCTRCLRSVSVCDCAEIRAILPSFRIVLLQHPKERRNSIGTARLTHLCLGNSTLIPGTEFDQDPEVNAILDHPENDCVLLFPGEGSLNLSLASVSVNTGTLKLQDRGKESSKKLVVFVIDGTWSHAKGMVRRSSRLRGLPRICFTPDTPSQYKVRKQPNAFCLSTLEAVHRLIELLDPSAEPEILIRLFSKMVDRQIACGGLKLLREKNISNLQTGQ